MRHPLVGIQGLRARLSRARATAMPRPSAAPMPLRAAEDPGLELSQLWRYIVVALVVVGCGMLHTWTKIERVGTAVALDQAERMHRAAVADQARLELELASLMDPHRLDNAAAKLELEGSLPIVAAGVLAGSNQ